MTQRFRLAAVLAVAFAATACAHRVQPPTASPTGPANVAAGAIVQLDGSQSSDPQSLPLSFHWQLQSLPAGSHAALNDPAVVNPSFLADVKGSYVVQLIVSDGVLTSLPATATVAAGPCGALPLTVVIKATPSSALTSGANTGAVVQLSATVTDPNSAAPCNIKESFSYAWSFQSLPAGSKAALNDATATNPSFVADLPGTYSVAVTVTDSTGLQGSETQPLTIGSCGNNPPQIQEITAAPPAPNVGDVVQLTGSVNQPDNAAPCSAAETLSYDWSFVALPVGSRGTLNSATLSQPSFTVDVAGAYTVRLVVTDSAGHVSAPSTLTITTSQCGEAVPQVASIAVGPAAPDVGQVAQLTAVISDADALAPCDLSPGYTYAWKILAQPAGSSAALNNAAAADPSLLPDVPGSYTVGLIVTKVEIGVPTSGGAPADAGTVDAGTADAGTADAGTADAGTADAGAADAGAVDAGAADAGAVDAGTSDAGTTADAGAADAGLAPDAGTVGSDAGTPPTQNPVALAIPVSSPLATFTFNVSVCGSASPTVLATSSATSVNAGQTVQLTATPSDADALAPCNLTVNFSYAWSIVALPQGSSARLNNAAAANPSFVADLPGAYVAQVQVTDQHGRQGLSQVTISAGSCGVLLPQVVINPSPGASVNAQSTVQLVAQVTDPNATGACSVPENEAYAWALVSVPVGSAAALNNAAASDPSFFADVPGQYVAMVTVTDSSGQKTVQTATVTAQSCGSNPPVVAAGGLSATPAAPDVGQVTQLAATFSDADNDVCSLGRTFSYAWLIVGLPSGSRARLNAPSSLDPSFTPDVPGTYDLQFTVTDSVGRSSVPQLLAITAAVCGSNLPTFTPTASGSPLVFQPVQLDTGAVTDGNTACEPNAANLSYAWTLTQLPLGSRARLNSSSVRNPSFVPDVAGTYSATVVVTDGLGNRSLPETVSVSVPTCGGSPATPIIAANYESCPGGNLATAVCPTTSKSGNSSTSPCVTPAIGGGGCGFGNAVRIQLDGSQSFDLDNTAACGLSETLSYFWELLEVPIGSGATLSATNSIDPWFAADVSGSYVARLYVNDGTPATPVPAAVFYLSVP